MRSPTRVSTRLHRGAAVAGALLSLVAARTTLALTPSGTRAGRVYQGKVVVLDGGRRVRIGRPLDAGYFSVGHEGTLDDTGERVALKIWNPKWWEHRSQAPTYGKDHGQLERLAKAHPAFVHSYGTGTVQGSGERVLVTELAGGELLRTRSEPRTLGKAVRITTRVLRAIDASHHVGLGGHDLNLGNATISGEHSASVRLFDVGSVRPNVGPQVVRDDVRRAAILMLKVLVPKHARGYSPSAQLEMVPSPAARQVLRRALRGGFPNAQALATALAPFRQRTELPRAMGG
jgi:hypothetical protein